MYVYHGIYYTQSLDAALVNYSHNNVVTMQACACADYPIIFALINSL